MRLAVRAWPWRLPALVLSVVVFAIVTGVVLAGSQWLARFVFTLAGPVVGLAWALLCVASWFHPEHGTLSRSARVVGKLPALLQGALRWYAFIFLAFFVFFCVVAWPAFALSNLWLLVR